MHKTGEQRLLFNANMVVSAKRRVFLKHLWKEWFWESRELKTFITRHVSRPTCTVFLIEFSISPYGDQSPAPFPAHRGTGARTPSPLRVHVCFACFFGWGTLLGRSMNVLVVCLFVCVVGVFDVFALLFRRGILLCRVMCVLVACLCACVVGVRCICVFVRPRYVLVSADVRLLVSW